jgi:hypothetical protein
MNWAEPMDFLRKRLKGLKIFLYALMGLAVVFDLLAPRHEAHFFGDHIPGFWSVFGFVGCLLLIKVSKGLAHTILSRREDFYG